MKQSHIFATLSWVMFFGSLKLVNTEHLIQLPRISSVLYVPENGVSTFDVHEYISKINGINNRIFILF